MKKFFSEKIIALILVFVAFIAAYYFYQKGEIAVLPRKEKGKIEETFTVQLPISEREFRLSYKDKLDSTFDIANFEEGENWYGEGEFDYATFYEGESSLFVTSLDGKKVTVSLRKNFDIEEVLNFKFLVHLATDPTNLEGFNLIFVGKDSQYKFPIREINQGWNFLILPKEKFSREGREGKEGEEIQEVVVELVSRPKTRSTVNLDSLWAEKEDEYQKDWNTDGDKLLSLKKKDNLAGLLVISMGGSRATLKKGSAKDYSFQTKLIPLKSGEFGLFLRGDYKSGYGYYLMMGGVETNTWRIYKYGPFEEKVQSLELAKGNISNFKMEQDKTYWLKAKMIGSRIEFYFSADGREFIQLGEVNDGSFASGGVGLTVSGGNMVLVDEIQFLKN